MADLRFENPATTDQFRALLGREDVKLPLSASETDCGVILDADGRAIMVIDVDRERGDRQVTLIAAWIITVVNTCGGFRAEAKP